jgi:hypothetical protein
MVRSSATGGIFEPVVAPPRRRMVLVAGTAQAPSTRIVPLSAVYGSVAAVFVAPGTTAKSAVERRRPTISGTRWRQLIQRAAQAMLDVVDPSASILRCADRPRCPRCERSIVVESPVLHASSEKTYLLNLRGSGRVQPRRFRQFRAHAREIEASIEAIEDRRDSVAGAWD